MSKFKDLKRTPTRCHDLEGRAWFVCNGRPIVERGPKKHEHIVICAKTKAHAARLLSKWDHKLNSMPEDMGRSVNCWLNEINVYYSKGAWGNDMNNVEVEHGLWVCWKRVGGVYEKVV